MRLKITEYQQMVTLFSLLAQNYIRSSGENKMYVSPINN